MANKEIIIRNNTDLDISETDQIAMVSKLLERKETQVELDNWCNNCIITTLKSKYTNEQYLISCYYKRIKKTGTVVFDFRDNVYRDEEDGKIKWK